MNIIYKQLQSDQESERMYAIDDLAEKMNDEIFELFLERLKLEHSQLVKDKLVLQMEVAIAEHKVGGGIIFARLFALFMAHNAYLRSSAVQILSAGDNAVAKFLSANFADSNADVRKLIIDTLAVIKTDVSLSTIRKAIDDKDINVKITAIEHLGNLKDSYCTPQLLAMLQSTDKDMLVMSVCEKKKKVGSTDDISQILQLFLPDNNIENLKSLYFSSVLILIAKVWHKTEILSVLQSKKIKNNYDNYQLEILDFLTIAIVRYRELVDDPIVLNTITELLKVKNMHEQLPYIIFSILDNSKNHSLKDKLNELYSSEESNIYQMSENIIKIISQQHGV